MSEVFRKGTPGKGSEITLVEEISKGASDGGGGALLAQGLMDQALFEMVNLLL
jgi:hypothetical protein